MTSLKALREALLRVGLFASSAIIIPYCIWEYAQEPGSFSRVPVTLGILLLCVITFLLYFSTTLKLNFGFSWRRAFRVALLFVLLGLGVVGVLSILLFPYLCERIARFRERSGLSRPSFHPNLGLVLLVVQMLVTFPLLNQMYFRGTQGRMWHPDYNSPNIFYDINADGFRGPRVPVERDHARRLMFIGDSSPFGWPYRWQESFPFIVGDILKARGADVEIVNTATIGQSDGEIRRQLPYFLKYRPDLVFLMTGIHYHRADSDYRRLLKEGAFPETGWRPFLVVPPMLVEFVVFSIVTSPVLLALRPSQAQRKAQDARDLESFTAQLRAVVQQIRASGTHLYLVDYPTPGAERRVQDAVRRVAQETGTDYIPLFDLIGKQIKSALHDSIHPNRAGHRLIAQEIASVAASALR